MSEYKDPAPDLRANRRKEIFRVVRGARLTGQRGGAFAEPTHVGAAGSRKAVAEQESQSVRRVRLGSTIEDEADSAEVRAKGRYLEPND